MKKLLIVCVLFSCAFHAMELEVDQMEVSSADDSESMDCNSVECESGEYDSMECGSSDIDEERQAKIESYRSLYQAISRGFLKSVRDSLEQDLDINVRDQNGESPLIHAVFRCPEFVKLEMIKLLAEKQPDPRIVDNDGDNALMIAIICREEMPLINTLLTLKPDIDINAQNNYGETAFMLAVLCANVQAASFLAVYPRVNCLLKNDEGEDVLSLAQASKYERIRKLVPFIKQKMQTQELEKQMSEIQLNTW